MSRENRAYLSSDWKSGELQWAAYVGEVQVGPYRPSAQEALNVALEAAENDGPSNGYAGPLRKLKEQREAEAKVEDRVEAETPQPHLRAVEPPVAPSPQTGHPGHLVEDPPGSGNFRAEPGHPSRSPFRRIVAEDGDGWGERAELGQRAGPPPREDALHAILAELRRITDRLTTLERWAEPARLPQPSPEGLHAAMGQEPAIMGPTATEAMATEAAERRAALKAEPIDRPLWLRMLTTAAYGDPEAVFTSMDALVDTALNCAWREGHKRGTHETAGPPEAPGAA